MKMKNLTAVIFAASIASAPISAFALERNPTGQLAECVETSFEYNGETHVISECAFPVDSGVAVTDIADGDAANDAYTDAREAAMRNDAQLVIDAAILDQARQDGELADEVGDRQAGDAALQQNLDSEEQTRITNDRVVDSRAIARTEAEALSRANADAGLQADILSEEQTRITNDRVVDSRAIARTEAESLARIQADVDEATARYDADLAEAQQRIADIQAERDAREAEDTALWTDQDRQDGEIATNSENIGINTAAINSRGITDDRQDGQINDLYEQNEAQDVRLDDHEDRLNGLDNDISTLRKGIAGVAAMTAIHYDTDYVGVQAGAGVGYFDGQEALALGVGGALSDRWFVNANVFTDGGGDETGGSAGFTFRF